MLSAPADKCEAVKWGDLGSWTLFHAGTRSLSALCITYLNDTSLHPRVFQHEADREIRLCVGSVWLRGRRILAGLVDTRQHRLMSCCHELSKVRSNPQPETLPDKIWKSNSNHSNDLPPAVEITCSRQRKQLSSTASKGHRPTCRCAIVLVVLIAGPAKQTGSCGCFLFHFLKQSHT